VKNYCDGGEAILEAIRRLGCDYIFASPGSEWGPVWEALARQKAESTAGPTYLDCWHETLAVDMTIGYTQMTGRLQAVMLHAGVGLLQGSMGIQCAQTCEVPMVVMSGEALTYGEDPNFDPGAQWYRSLSVVGGPHRLVESVTKWSGQAPSIQTLYETFIRSGELAQRTPKGPVYVNVPIETMLREWSPPADAREVPVAPKTQPQPQDVGKVADLLMAAKCPVIITEDAGRDAAGFQALVELAELMALPVVEGHSSAYANFPKDHPLHQGGNLAPYQNEADLVLLAACRAPWYPPSNKPANATIVSIGDNPLKGHVVYQNLQANLYLEGDVALTLRLLAEELKARGSHPDKYKERHDRLRREHDNQHAERGKNTEGHRTDSPIDPYWLLGALRETMPDDAIYVDETIVHSRMIQNDLSWSRPHSFFRSRGGLGQGFGLALGCKLAAPDRTSVLLIGDGSFLYNPIIQAFGASRDHKLPVLVIVFNNKNYEAMRQNHLSYYPDGTAYQKGIYHGVHIDGPDYAELGKPFGFSGERVENPEDLVAALRNGLAAVKGGKTHILNVVLTDKNPRAH
jgi:thiamine pyrophosphate-dependent acetolactate synthase large subunit-like protein